MFKKALIAGAVLAASSSIAFANGGSFIAPPAHHVGNFYVGIGVSRDVANLKTQVSHLYVDNTNNRLNINKDFHWSGQGIDGRLFTGYGITLMNQYYIGAEVYGVLSSLKGDFKKSVVFNGVPFRGTGDWQNRWRIGVSLIPGVKITDNTMLFARVGWTFAQFNVNGSIDGVNSQFAPVAFFRNRTWKNGIEVGLGFEANVTQNIALRGEWDWNRYQNLKETVSRSPTTYTHTASFRSQPTIDTFTFSAIYKFFT